MKQAIDARVFQASARSSDFGEPEDQPHRGRGRPRNERRQPTPDPRAFEDIVAAIQALPRKARPAAKEHAIALVDADPAIAPGGGKVYRALQQRLKWFSGIIFVMSEKLAAELGVSLSTVERGLRALQRRGYIKRKRLEGTARGDGYDLWQTTLPAVVPLAQNHSSKKSAEPPVKKIKTTRQKCGHEPLFDDEEERESARAKAFENSRAAAPWSFALPTEAQVAVYAQAAAAWYGRPLDLDDSRQRLRQLLATLIQREKQADVEEALNATIAIVQGVQSRRGNLAIYLSKALADEVSRVKHRRAQDEADNRVIAQNAEAKIATEKAIGVKREQAMDATVAANAADKQNRQARQGAPTGRYATDQNGRKIFNPEAKIYRMGFTDILGAQLNRIFIMLGEFPDLTVEDIEKELEQYEDRVMPRDKNGRPGNVSVLEVVRATLDQLQPVVMHRKYGDPTGFCGGMPHCDYWSTWLVFSKEFVGKVISETGLTNTHLNPLFQRVAKMAAERWAGDYSRPEFHARYEAKFIELAKAEQEKWAKREAERIKWEAERIEFAPQRRAEAQEAAERARLKREAEDNAQKEMDARVRARFAPHMKNARDELLQKRRVSPVQRRRF